MGIETIAIIATAASLAAAGASAGMNENARQEARADQKDEQKKARKLQEDARIQNETATAARAARARQGAFAAQSGGYAGTINTSPLGLSSNTSGKTALGA